MVRIVKAIAITLFASGVGLLAIGPDGRDRLRDGIERMTRAAAPAAGQGSQEARLRSAAVAIAASSDLTAPRATHQVLAARIGSEPGIPPRRDETARLRVAQSTTNATRDPVRPAVRPQANGLPRGDGPTGAATDKRSAETRLAESIQKELKRVGCYAGDLDGDWGPETRRAMKAFNDRVNATLPTDQPDYILLTLLQGHSAKACGAVCPQGQALSDGGKCLPHSVIAEERRRLAASNTATTTASQDAAPAEARTRAAAAVATAPASPVVVTPPQVPSRAELERRRIEAAEARRRQHAAEAAARAEADRLAQLAAAEKARSEAEKRRKAELAALAARKTALPKTVPARGHEPIGKPITTASLAPQQPPLPLRPSAAFQRTFPGPELARAETGAPRTVTAEPRGTRVVHRHVTRHAHRKPRGARFVGRFVPPPAYRLGGPPRFFGPPPIFRLAPRRVSQRRHNPQQIFRDLQYRMP
ncbi:MAG: peptidoglycan-binding domain-containing protein [Hyphomicrobiaceae bacterium]